MAKQGVVDGQRAALQQRFDGRQPAAVVPPPGVGAGAEGRDQGPKNDDASGDTIGSEGHGELLSPGHTARPGEGNRSAPAGQDRPALTIPCPVAYDAPGPFPG